MDDGAMDCWYVEPGLTGVARGRALRRDRDGWHVVGVGYLQDSEVHGDEASAKTDLARQLRREMGRMSRLLAELEPQTA